MFPDLLLDDVFRLETSRLWLRWPRAADAATITSLAADPEVARMTTDLPHPYPQGAGAEYVLRARQSNLSGEALSLVLTHKPRHGEPIGAISLRPQDTGVAELGFWLGKAHAGHGLMREAIDALTGLAFRICDFDAISASVRLADERSSRLLGDCGFIAAGAGIQQAPTRGGAVPVAQYLLRRASMAAGQGVGAADHLGSAQMLTA